MTKETMIDEVIRNRGFEDKYTVWFCKLCEECDNLNVIMNAFVAVVTLPFEEEEEEEA